MILLASLLQFQCGIQQINGVNLNYGTLVYLSDGDSTPQFGFFSSYAPEYSEHPFCQTLRTAMNQNQKMILEVDPDGKTIRLRLKP